jgi:hypothetical protein
MTPFLDQILLLVANQMSHQIFNEYDIACRNKNIMVKLVKIPDLFRNIIPIFS